MATSVFASALAQAPPTNTRLTVKQVAERLSVHPATIYHWAASGRLPCIRLSRKALRFSEADIAKYEQKHTTGVTR
jgi:excisionase family DNA binding protein